MKQAYDHKVLIVDDEKQVGKSIGRLLSREDIDFVYSDSGESALEEIRSSKTPFSLILSDQRMPGIQGTKLLEHAKKISPDTSRFLMTGYSDMETIIDSVNKGSVHRYIDKPWDNYELLESIKFGLKQYEKILENAQLLITVKKQNKELYALDTELMENVNSYNQEIEKLDRQIKIFEKQIRAETPTFEAFSDQIITQMEEAVLKNDQIDPEKINHFYSCCIKTIYKEFDEMAMRNGFEMPHTIAGDAHD
jgi:response regulator RpfG family c-di-GMP phosphodiesterase